MGQHLQNAGRIAYLTEAGAFRFSEHLHASYGTTRKYISDRETVFLVRGMAQSGEGREDAKDMKVCQYSAIVMLCVVVQWTYTGREGALIAAVTILLWPAAEV